MKRKITLLALVLVVVVLATSVLFACNDGVNGKYYKYENGVKDENSWIEIKGKKWSDSDGLSGKVKIDGESIVLMEDDIELLPGTIKDGVLYIGWEPTIITFVKDGATPPSNGESGNTQIGSNEVDNKAKITNIQGGTVDGLVLSLEVAPSVNDVELSGMIETAKNASWSLYKDKTGQTLIPTKYATNLLDGDNFYYIVVTSEDGSLTRTYTLNIYRNFYTNVYFTANNQIQYEALNVLSHTTVNNNAPTVITGYTLVWPVSSYYVTEKNKTFYAEATPNQYVITLDAGEGSVQSNTFTASYERVYALEVPTRTGYTFEGWYKGDTKLTDYTGGCYAPYTFTEDITVTAKYTINNYTLTVLSENETKGTVNAVSGSYAYNSQVTLVATNNAGHTFAGWYLNYQKVSDSPSYTVTIPAENVRYEARWSTYKVYTNTNLSNAGTYTPTQEITAGETVTLTASTNNGYTWLGWYDGETKVSKGTSLTYTFTMGEESKTYTAKWSKVEIEKNITKAGSIAMTKYAGTTVVSFNLNGASGSIASQTITATQGLTYPTIPTRSGYVFAGWYSNSACLGEPFDFSSDVTGNVTLYAKWISHSGYGVLKAGNNGSMTLISKSSSSYRYYAFVPLVSETITIYTTGSSDTYGYLYNSSKSQLTYDDDDGSNNNFSISYAVTAGTLYYIRPCAYGSSSVTATVYVDASIPSSGGNSSGGNSYVVGDRAVLTATTNNGYTWLGWYDGETKVSEGTSLTYTFTMGEESKTYTAKWMSCPITLAKNISAAGSVSGVSGATAVGAQTTITATTNAGYTWLGWYDGETKVSEGTSLTYTFTMGEESKTYTAKWTYYTISTETNLSGAGTYTQHSDYKVTVGEEVTLTATTNNGYTWLGWYDGATKVSEGTSLTYTFTMGEESKTYTAKWEQCTSHTLDSNCVCTKCKIIQHSNIVGGFCEACGEMEYIREGNYIYFGDYPQSEVTDSTLKSALTSSAGTLPTSSNSGSWTSYGGSVSNYMWYVDKEYEGEKYRGVYFTSYRPSSTTWSSSSSNSYQDDNGYSTGTIYWFKYEPIKWRILSESNGKALILAELILDAQEFYPSTSSHTENGTTIYANNWEYSTIRKWLNETFYNVAFNDLQKALIVATELDNKTTAYYGSSNSYATCQNNTTDKVFLLSYKDMLNTSYGFSSSYQDTAKEKKTSDYAQVQGADTYTSSSYSGDGFWWLRSPNYSDGNNASGVNFAGRVCHDYYVNYTNYGVVPALTIML